GHTIGHALETETDYEHFLHGEAIAWGMVAAANIAVMLGKTTGKTAARITDGVLGLGPLPKVEARGAAILRRMQSDKQTKDGAVGAAPIGARDRESAAAAVREMFTSIAPRYDLLNHVLSMNVDRLWWRRTARSFAAIVSKPEAQILDLCCGTGDMAFALRRQA